MSNEFTHFEKIDMHSHIGAVGEPFNINQDAEKMLEVMKEYNISKSLICSVSDDLNPTVKAAAEKYLAGNLRHLHDSTDRKRL